MSPILLDTNIVSYLFKGDTRINLYQQHLPGKELAISIMTLAELWQWAEMRNWGDTRRQQLQSALENYTILTIDTTICQIWAALRAHRSRIGLPISPQDA